MTNEDRLFVILGVSVIVTLIFLSVMMVRTGPTNKVCKDYRNETINEVPARCLKEFQNEL